MILWHWNVAITWPLLNPLNTALILWHIEMCWFHSWYRSQDIIATISTIVLTGLLQQLSQLIVAAFGYEFELFRKILFSFLKVTIWPFRRPIEELLKLLPGPHSETRRVNFSWSCTLWISFLSSQFRWLLYAVLFYRVDSQAVHHMTPCRLQLI